MMRIAILLLTTLCTALASCGVSTDYVIFLYDHGEANMIASMLSYAEEHDSERLKQLDFRLVFLGPAKRMLQHPPFSHFPNRCMAYEGNLEQRTEEMPTPALNQLCNSFHIRKKAWVGVSTVAFKQIAERYAKTVPVTALRDNPNPDGNTDYFLVADQVQQSVDHVILSSEIARKQLQNTTVVGHAPTEVWQHRAQALDRQAIIKKLNLDPKRPIIVFTGSYGAEYEKCFRYFLHMIKNHALQILVIPHPRTDGEFERTHCDLVTTATTLEALAIADGVIVTDPTSTIVLQANALKKPVMLTHPEPTPIAEQLFKLKVLHRVENLDDIANAINTPSTHDIFQKFGIPHDGAARLWQAFINKD